MTDYKRIIFLDVDGTLSSIPFLCKGKGFIDPENIKILNKLKDTGAEIVISSSWGEDADEPLMELGLEIPIIGHTEHFHVDWLCRGNEIEKWVSTDTPHMIKDLKPGIYTFRALSLCTKQFYLQLVHKTRYQNLQVYE